MIQLEKRIDAHIHYALPLEPEVLVDFMDKTGTHMANLVLVPSMSRLSCAPDALMAKYKYPDRFYVFSSLDVSGYFMAGKNLGKHMAKHIKNMRKCGCDGVKIIEGKPSMRKILPVPDFDELCWEPFWAYMESEQIPILWHLNDPEEYWELETATPLKKQMGDVYDETYISRESQYSQVFHILQRHPNIKIIFAHFFFMSRQLQQLGQLFDTYPNIMVDMTPGSEMYRHLSANHDQAQAFFKKYYKRILYGTDVASRCVMLSRMEDFNEKENLRRLEIIDSFFTPGMDTVIGSDGEYLLDVADFRLRGLDLIQEELNHIYFRNFLDFVGETPAPVDPRQVRKECRRILIKLKIMGMVNKDMPTDGSVAKKALAFFK